MLDKIFSAIYDYNMLQQGDRVVVALSGGADSVALLHFLQNQKNQLGIEIFAAHFNHGIRGEEADSDQAYVETMCVKMGLELSVGYGRMNEHQRPKGFSEETYARKLRYEFFEIMAKNHRAKIATAHTVSDNAETVLFRLARGTGPSGLAGIPPVRDSYIRPFIRISREEVEQYCNENSLAFVQDSTNKMMKYSRNRIRYKILPQMEKVHAGAVGSIGRMVEDMRDLQGMLQMQAKKLQTEAKRIDGGYAPEILLEAPKPIRLQVLYNLAGTKPHREMLEIMNNVLMGEPAAVQLSAKKTVCLKNNILYIVSRTDDFTEKKVDSVFPFLEWEYEFNGGYMFETQILTMQEYILHEKSVLPIDKAPTIYYADLDKINSTGVFRTRVVGDFFALPRRRVTKSLKKLMIENRLPAHKRDEIPIFAVENCVVWIFGTGFCDGVQVDKKTKKVLMIKLKNYEEVSE